MNCQTCRKAQLYGLSGCRRHPKRERVKTPRTKSTNHYTITLAPRNHQEWA